MMRWGPGCNDESTAAADACWLGAAWDSDILRVRAIRIPHSMFGDPLKMVINSLRMSFARDGDYLGVLLFFVFFSFGLVIFFMVTSSLGLMLS